MTMPCLSNKTALAMVFKLAEGAQKSWRRLNNQLPQIIEGVKFIDWLEVAAKPADPQAHTAARLILQAVTKNRR